MGSQPWSRARATASSSATPAATAPTYEDPFTLSSLLRSQEHTGYAEAIQPPGLALEMKDYQRQSLQWMIDHENMMEHGGLNAVFWEHWSK